ncbi:stage II sporulation protein M [Clostridiales bacterium]|nr:stage II sporulation protein M [Clostridiales bacterium]
MRRKNSSRWRIILMIVCVCFFIGIFAGAVSAGSLDSEQTARLYGYIEEHIPAEADFWRLYLKHGKYICAIWLAGLVSSGAVIIFIIMFTAGLFYGFSAAFVSAESGAAYLLSNIFPQSTILVPLYIFSAVWSLNFILNGFSNNGPKSRLKREKLKHMKEHIIILALCLIINAAACFAEIYVVSSASKILNLY